jgi:hypothetical protein
VTLEPAYGPEFYRVLLQSDIYALIPAGKVPREGEKVRFVMWKGADGQNVIPFFSSRSTVRRVLTGDTQALRIRARGFFESCRGAIVVLNPNERFFCRLMPHEVALLLDTGSPSAAINYQAPHDKVMELAAPPAPPEMIGSLSLLLAQHPGIERAYMVSLRSNDNDVACVWLVAVVIDAGDPTEQLAHQLAALLTDQPPAANVDLLRLTPEHPNAVAMAEAMQPFYDRATFGSKVVMSSQAGTQ